MPSTKLTASSVKKLAAPTATGKPVIHWDTSFRFFGVRCNAKQPVKTYLVQCKVKGTRKERRVSIGQVDVWSFDDAKTEALRLAEMMSKGIDPKATDKLSEADEFTVRDALTYYLRHTKVRQRTRDDYKNLIEMWMHHGPEYVRHMKLRSWLDRPIFSITRDEVLERHRRIQEMIATGTLRENVDGKSRADDAMRVFRAIWNEADRRFEVNMKNPVRMKGKWNGSQPRETFVEDHQKPVFYEALMSIENTIHRDAIRFMLFSGLRVSATCALRWQQVDLEHGNFTLRVEDQKGKFHQTLPLGSYLHEMLIARRSIGNPGGWVFPTNTGKVGHIYKPISKGGWYVIENAVGQHFCNHDLRRTWATVLAEVAPNQTVFDYLTHHKPARVSDRYAQLKPDRLRPIVERATAIMKEACNIPEIATDNVVSLTGKE